jgi:nicotinate-nucleotide adenylyltransferase
VIKLPPFAAGQRIGLFGGSFNPPHKGHRAVALYAMKRLGLDWVWWLVAPQNPLKDGSDYADYQDRLAQTRRIARHPRFVVSDIEEQLGSRNTAQTLAGLAAALRRGRFVWIMGADSFADLHRWHDWQDIAETIPFAILARPGYSIRALNGRAALRYAEDRLPASAARLLPETPPPAWVFVAMPLRKESSTAIRKRRKKAPALDSS